MSVHTATLTVLRNSEFMNASHCCVLLHLGGLFLSNKVRLCIATFLTTDNLAANTGQVPTQLSIQLISRPALVGTGRSWNLCWCVHYSNVSSHNRYPVINTL